MGNATQAAENVTLYFKEGSSDKVYAAQLEQSGKGWIVNFQYGRRGSTMNSGTKTQAPVPFEKAKAIFDKLVAEKTGKGYTPGEDGTAYKHTSAEARDTSIRPQLLNDIEESEVERLIEDHEWVVQEKMDGKRMLVKKDSAIIGINRKGLSVALPDPVHKAAEKTAASFVVDGESVGDVLHAFDLLEVAGEDLRSKTYDERLRALQRLGFKGAIRIVLTAATPKEKRDLIAKVRAARGEGVVFKRRTAQYKAGRPDRGGVSLKQKFYATGSFIVSKVNAKRSVALELADGTPIGNVTIPPNKEIPKAGDIVEIRYLYCYKGGSLYQPTFLVKRDDIDSDGCTAAQLKYKASEEDEA